MAEKLGFYTLIVVIEAVLAGVLFGMHTVEILSPKLSAFLGFAMLTSIYIKYRMAKKSDRL